MQTRLCLFFYSPYLFQTVNLKICVFDRIQNKITQKIQTQIVKKDRCDKNLCVFSMYSCSPVFFLVCAIIQKKNLT